ncbi:MAG: copper resistance protein CopC [Gemmatimonadetes bacterium]|nr:copper resistance protein CopC [Gemmatimonadota bacterium]
MTHSAFRVAALTSCIVFAAAFGGGVTATARHTELKKSSPKANDTLTVAPKELQFWFSQKIELPTSSVRLSGPGGAVVATGALHGQATADAPVVAAVTGAMAPGAYTIAWVAGSKDGHAVKGTIAFVLKAAH